MFRCLWIVVGVVCTGCSGAQELPPRAADLNALGAQALAAGDLETADARLSLALEYSPEFVEALTNLGLVELRRGNFDRAEQLLSRARRLNPDVAQAHHGLGVLAERRGRWDLASEHYRTALLVDPGFVESRANLARLLFESQRFQHALVQYRLLSEAAPDRIEGRLGLAHTLLSLARFSEAKTVLEAVARDFGETPELRLLEARRRLLTGSPGSARDHLLPLTAPGGALAALAHSWTAICELALGRPEVAIASADAALALEPDDPLATYALAVALDDTKNPGAAAWLERALLANPHHAGLRARLARYRQHGHSTPAQRLHKRDRAR